MSTEYHLKQNPCRTCGCTRQVPAVIGTTWSEHGRCRMGLNPIPGTEDFPVGDALLGAEWIRLINEPGTYVEDEYGKRITKTAMIEWIREWYRP